MCNHIVPKKSKSPFFLTSLSKLDSCNLVCLVYVPEIYSKSQTYTVYIVVLVRKKFVCCEYSKVI